MPHLEDYRPLQDYFNDYLLVRTTGSPDPIAHKLMWSGTKHQFACGVEQSINLWWSGTKHQLGPCSLGTPPQIDVEWNKSSIC